MNRGSVYLGVALLVAVAFGATVFVTAQAVGGTTISTVLQQDPAPTPTEMPAMDMSGMNMPDANVTMTDTMNGMDMSGMDMSGQDMSGQDMAGMSGMDAIPSDGVPVATATAGAQPLDYELDGDTKVFTLTAQVVQWPIMEGVTMTAYTYNGVVPGPLLRVTEGDKVRVVLQNQLPDATSIHWHGIQVPTKWMALQV